jgi:pyridoxine 5-phosphate synthase
VTKLSVNINKIATLRNARGGDVPNVVQTAVDCQRFGAEGITVHPRPDERHIRYQDVRDLRPIVTTEFNIEGNPSPEFIRLVVENKPEQVTLVPDAHDAITSSAGWDTVRNKAFLEEVCAEFRHHGIRVSIFVDPLPKMVTHAAECGADRVELYTEPYAALFPHDPEAAVAPFIAAALEVRKVGLGLNAGHDLNLQNLYYFNQNIPGLLEVSIGHALIADALYLGMENAINLYKRKLR